MGTETFKVMRKTTTTTTTKLENMGKNSANNPKEGSKKEIIKN